MSDNAPIVPAPDDTTRELPPEIAWFADAPLFIDAQQVDALYDAVLRPDYEQHLENFGQETTIGSKVAGGLNLSLGGLIPGLNFSAEKGSESAQTYQLSATRVTNSYRHLLLLGIHYARLGDRLLTLKFPMGKLPIESATDVPRTQHPATELEGRGSQLFDPNYVHALPRAFVLLDFDEKTKFIPTALESNSRVQLLYEKLQPRLVRPGGVSAPGYPGSKASEVDREAYWMWYAERFNDTQAMITVEEAVEGERISWIDYRVPIPPDEQKTLHLHVSARGEFDTGVFAYNLVKRGYKHGLRVVGTLKSEPDVNVLAIFDR